MTLQETIDKLKECNRWRTGEDIPMPNPKDITEAIETAINLLEKLK